MPKSSLTLIKILKFSALIFFIAIIVLKPNTFSPVRSRVVDVARVPLKILRAAADQSKRLIPFASYRSEIRRLKEKITFLESETARLKEYHAENQRLRELLDFKKEVTYKFALQLATKIIDVLTKGNQSKMVEIMNMKE